MNRNNCDISLFENAEMGDDYQGCGCHQTSPGRTNAFLDIRGFPYILDDYLDNIVFKQIDPASIINGISIESTEHNHSNVSISVDDTKPMFGNRIKYSKLMESIFRTVRTNAQNILPVIQKQLIVQVTYQLECQRTGQILKTATEKLAIRNRDYYLNTNVQSISDNSIDNCVISNFVDSLTISITEFLHGSETMICRITGVDVLYPAVMPHHHHHKDTQQMIPSCDSDMYNHVCHSYQYNYLYHFDNHGTDIHLHSEEIEDNRCENVSLVPVVSFKLDKTFIVNTGHTVTFNFAIWKSDVIMVKNTKRIEEILGGAPYRKLDKTIEEILDRLDDIKQANTDQDSKLGDIVKRLDNVMTEDQATGVSNDIINSYDTAAKP